MSTATLVRSRRQTVLEAEKSPGHRIEPEGVPASLTELERWVCWAWEWNGKKWTKVSKQGRFPTRNASSTDATTWCDFSTAVKASEEHDVGIGFVLDGDGTVGIDLDDCRDPKTGKLSGWAQDIVGHLATYTEISSSQTGVKIFVRGSDRRGF